MRAATTRAGVPLLLVTSLSLAAPAAYADELLVMPYACSIVGGRPLLTRAPEQSHLIIGRREQRAFTACSPVNPDMCRNWTIHRFDVDCEGARVPWVSLVASVAEETTRRAWIEDGRLVLRMPSSWSLEPDDPCARPPSFDDRFGFGRMRRYCADRRAMAPPPIVEMPFGFAPMLGIDAIFVKSSGPNTPPPPGPPAVAAWPPAPPAKVTPAEPSPPSRPEPARAPAERAESAGKSATSNAAPEKAAQPPQKTASVRPPDTKEPTLSPKTASPPAETSGSPVVPKIINRPTTDSESKQERPEAAATKTAAASSDEPRQDARAAASRDASTPAADPGPDTAGSGSEGVVRLLSVVRSPTVGVLAFGGLALVLLAAFGLARRHERLAGTPPPHDIGAVSLGGRRRRGQLAPRSEATSRRAAEPVPPPTPVQPVREKPVATWVDRIPQTRAEALQMLGIGVSPDATETAVKKIVDGLRLSWHPDLAKNEADRQLREFRVKQINAAWDLIQGKRVERLDS